MHLKLENIKNTIIHGDVLDRLRELPDNIVQTVITSPPYWGLRDYGTAEWEGGDPECDHIETRGGQDKASKKQITNAGSQDIQYRDNCVKCGAIRIDNQLGLEATPEEYVAKMVEIFAEVRRVLRDDGTLWLNLGDSYVASGSGACHDTWVGNFSQNQDSLPRESHKQRRSNTAGLKPKDLCGIPWRVAFALQADGWYLRSDIIWSKPNPMPESVTDRPTKAHEYMFLFAKSGTNQYWTHRDKNGIRKQPGPDYRWTDEITKDETTVKPDGWTIKNKMGWSRLNLWQGRDYYYDADAIREGNQVYTRKAGGYKNHHEQMVDDYSPFKGKGGFADSDITTVGRNRRTVWEIATQPYPEAHFATFPEKLIEPCILAGSNDRACEICGAAWERVTESSRTFESGSGQSGNPISGKQQPVQGAGYGDIRLGPTIKSTTLGFRPTCEHDNGDSRSIILDPFMGSGTVALVALKHSRDYIGIELKLDYIDMAMKRLKPLGNKLLPQQEKLL